jgi:phage repressor protein C with HTH and peptisase S24 domain
MHDYYDKRSTFASHATIFAADIFDRRRHGPCVLSSTELLSKLKSARDAAVLTNADVQSLLKLPSSRVAEIFEGKRAIKIDEMKALVERYGWDVSQPAMPARMPISDDTVEIVALDLSLSMGPGTVLEDFVESEPVKMDLGLLQSITRTPSNRLRLVKGIGDSMEPTLRTGDRIMVDINERALARINGIYWVDHLGTHGIKRLRASGQGRVMVISDNPLIENYEVAADEIRIEGRVIWFAREL